MAERELIVKTIYEAAEKSFAALLKEHPDDDFLPLIDENTKRLNPEESYNIWKKEFMEIY